MMDESGESFGASETLQPMSVKRNIRPVVLQVSLGIEILTFWHLWSHLSSCKGNLGQLYI